MHGIASAAALNSAVVDVFWPMCTLQVDDSLFDQKPEEAPPPPPVGVSTTSQEAEKAGAHIFVDIYSRLCAACTNSI